MYHVQLGVHSLAELQVHTELFCGVITDTAYLDNLGVRTAAVSCGGVHPCALWRGTLLPQGTLLLLYAPTTLKPGVCLQTHPTAVPQCIALIQVGWGERKKKKRIENFK